MQGSWNVTRRCESLVKLTSKSVSVIQDHVLQPKEGGGKNKSEVAPGGGDQSTS